MKVQQPVWLAQHLRCFAQSPEPSALVLLKSKEILAPAVAAYQCQDTLE